VTKRRTTRGGKRILTPRITGGVKRPQGLVKVEQPDDEPRLDPAESRLKAGKRKPKRKRCPIRPLVSVTWQDGTLTIDEWLRSTREKRDVHKPSGFAAAGIHGIGTRSNL
jgi:hypothetical protein